MGGAQLFFFGLLVYPAGPFQAGDSVGDLLITTQWSSNPTDLIDSNCCPGLSAPANPPLSASALLHPKPSSPPLRLS